MLQELHCADLPLNLQESIQNYLHSHITSSNPPRITDEAQKYICQKFPDWYDFEDTIK